MRKIILIESFWCCSTGTKSLTHSAMDLKTANRLFVFLTDLMANAGYKSVWHRFREISYYKTI